MTHVLLRVFANAWYTYGCTYTYVRRYNIKHWQYIFVLTKFDGRCTRNAYTQYPHAIAGSYTITKWVHPLYTDILWVYDCLLSPNISLVPGEVR